MSLDENKLLIRRFFNDVLNAGNYDAVAQYIAEDYIDHNASENPQGVEGYQQHMAAVLHTYGDFHVTLQFQVAEDDLVVSYIVATGIHQNGWLGLQPTGRVVTMTGINIDRVKNGKIVEHWGEANTLSGLFQMGAQIIQGDV